LYRLLILTGLRLNEVADATWSEIDFRNGVWIVPATRMKGKDGRAVDHVVPITAEIAAILESLPRFKNGDFLFSVTFARPRYGYPTRSRNGSTRVCCAHCRQWPAGVVMILRASRCGLG
jgi:integrase